MDTCTFHNRRVAVAALTTTVHLCRHCLYIAMPWLDTCRNTGATPYDVAIYLDECAAFVRNQPR